MLENKANIVFSPCKIGTIEIPNRLVRSATTELKASDDGFVTDELIDVYKELAEGGVGLTISAVANVRKDGKQIAKMMGNYSGEYLEGLTRLAGEYHDVSSSLGQHSKIFLQVGHCGLQVGTHGGWAGEIISSSKNYNKIAKKSSRPMDIEDIHEIIGTFAEAINRAKLAGFDGVQLHGAHGYLINQFYSPYFNMREDQFGGSSEKRAKFVIEILKSSRKLVGSQFPITMKMNGEDKIEGGLTIEESAQLAKIFCVSGIDAIEISSYIMEVAMLEKPMSLPPESQINVRKRNLEAFNLEYAKKIKNTIKSDPKTDKPLILVGGLYRFEKIQSIIEKDNIEFCAMCRPLISQPDLPNLWKKGPLYPEADCIYCNQCCNELVKGSRSKGVRCIHKEKLSRKRRNEIKVN